MHINQFPWMWKQVNDKIHWCQKMYPLQIFTFLHFMYFHKLNQFLSNLLNVSNMLLYYFILIMIIYNMLLLFFFSIQLYWGLRPITSIQLKIVSVKKCSMLLKITIVVHEIAVGRYDHLKWKSWITLKMKLFIYQGL